MMRESVRGFLVLAILSSGGPAAVAATTVFENQLDFLLAAGPLSTEDFEAVPLVGDLNGGGVVLLAFDGFRALSDTDALKVLDVQDVGNHGTSPGGPRYLSADTDSLLRTATVTLQFEPSVSRLGFYVVDLDTFDMEVTINGVSYVIPATGNGGMAYFGILSDTLIAEVLLDSLGSEVQYSLDDVAFPAPPVSIPAGAVPDGGSRPGLPLTVSRLPGGDLTLSWEASCLPTDDDFSVYEGTLGDYTSHLPVTCTTGGEAFTTFTPAAGGTYYVVVPRNLTREGSFGLASDGSERPGQISVCLLQELGACP